MFLPSMPLWWYMHCGQWTSFANVDNYRLVRGASLAHAVKINLVKMVEHVLTVWMVPLCPCDSGVRGERCQSGIEERAGNFCHHWALYEKAHVSYHCNCTEGMRPEENTENTTSRQHALSLWNVRLAERIGIVL